MSEVFLVDLGHFFSPSKLEERVSHFLKWNSVSEIPDFPIKTFEDLQVGATNGSYKLEIDYTTSNNFAWSLHGLLHSFVFLIFASAPLLAAVSAVVFAFYLKSYVLLIGVLAPFFAWLFSNPYNPMRPMMTIIALLTGAAAVALFMAGKVIPLIFCLLFVIPFFLNRLIYQLNLDKFRLVILNSETLFLYFFQNKKVGLKCNSTGKTFLAYG